MNSKFKIGGVSQISTIIITVLVLVGGFFGYEYYKKNTNSSNDFDGKWYISAIPDDGSISKGCNPAIGSAEISNNEMIGSLVVLNGDSTNLIANVNDSGRIVAGNAIGIAVFDGTVSANYGSGNWADGDGCSGSFTMSRTEINYPTTSTPKTVETKTQVQTKTYTAPTPTPTPTPAPTTPVSVPTTPVVNTVPSSDYTINGGWSGSVSVSSGICGPITFNFTVSGNVINGKSSDGGEFYGQVYSDKTFIGSSGYVNFSGKSTSATKASGTAKTTINSQVVCTGNFTANKN